MDELKLRNFRNAVRAIEREVERQFSSSNCCCGITAGQCHMLMEIELKGELTLKQMSMALDLDKSTLSRTADELFKSGFIERSEDQKDRRYTNLRLTEAGRKTAGEINAVWNKIYIDIFEYIPEEQHGSVIRSFRLFADALRKNYERGV
jgi:DNA-binding MarR family transcriptional regulator